MASLDRKIVAFLVRVMALLVLMGSPRHQFANAQLSSSEQCLFSQRTFNEQIHKKVYRVGVLAIRGADAAYSEFNSTFSDYLAGTAGQRFSEPLEFEMVPLNFLSLFGDVELAANTQGGDGVDFIYVNPSAYSCIETEYGANTLVSQISLRQVGGKSYELTRFGGVIVTRADNNNIQTIHDLKNKRVACASISGLGSGQMQFRAMQQVGLHHLQDPLQVVFTSNQGKVVNGVLKGQFDAGFVRTDQIERTKGTNGELVDKSKLKIINVKPDLTIDGAPFPFESSTLLYPEWNVASLPHVPDNVAEEVQSALLALDNHAYVGDMLLACYFDRNCDGNSQCEKLCYQDLGPDVIEVCRTTSRVAALALQAKTDGGYAGWRTTLSYSELRNMQEETGFIAFDPKDGTNRCVRSSQIFDAIVCPPGYFRRSKEDVSNGCSELGLDCYGYQCLCRPCIKAFDVDVFPLHSANQSNVQGCAKFDVCAKVGQRQTVRFRAIDNKKRENGTVTVTLFEGKNTLQFEAAVSKTNPWSYDFSFDTAGTRVGVAIFEVRVDSEQIPESPFRLEIIQADCDAEDSLKEANEFGLCVCGTNTVKIGGTCVSFLVLLSGIIVPPLIILGVGVYWYVERKKRQADSVWLVKLEELKFHEPPEILGRGTFGLVLLAEYRGTQVAVKRVIPPKVYEEANLIHSISRNQLLGSGETSSNFQNIGLESGDRNLQKEDFRDIQMFATQISSTDVAAVEADTMESGLGTSGKGIRTRDLESEKVPVKKKVRRQQSSHATTSIGENHNGGLEVSVEPSFGTEPITIDSAPAGRSSIDSWMPLRQPLSKQIDGSVSAIGLNKHASGSLPRGASYFDFANDKSTINNDSLPRPFKMLRGKFIDRDNENFGMISGQSAVGSASIISQAQQAGLVSTTTQNGKKSIFVLKKLSRCLDCCQPQDEYSALKGDFIIEMRHLSKLRHPCITTVMGAVIWKREEPMLVMEYMDHGSLYDLLHNETLVVEGELVLPILRDIAQGVRFLHAASPKVIHGDLKAQNVLVDSKFRAKVADFGLSQKKKVGATGTPLWMAPELLRGESENTAMSDVYSFGIILYEVYSRKDPYEGEKHLEVLRLVADPKINKRPKVPASCPGEVASLMGDCLEGEPLRRPTFETLDIRLKAFDVTHVEPAFMHLSARNKRSGKIEKSEELLFSVFPRHIAEALRDGKKIEPESRDLVTIFFSDIVGFTDISSNLPATKVSDLLDRLYLKLDSLSDKHDIFKIETIGDSYMAVTNLVKDQPDGVKRIAEFAVDACEVASVTMIDTSNPLMGFVQMRVGFHTGPVVANVVGSKSPRYTLIGDTVNTSSRMESTSLPGRIQCSGRSADLLRLQAPEMHLTGRGKIKVKGKGEMFTFWINEESSSAVDSYSMPKPRTCSFGVSHREGPSRAHN